MWITASDKRTALINKFSTKSRQTKTKVNKSFSKSSVCVTVVYRFPSLSLSASRSSQNRVSLSWESVSKKKTPNPHTANLIVPQRPSHRKWVCSLISLTYFTSSSSEGSQRVRTVWKSRPCASLSLRGDRYGSTSIFFCGMQPLFFSKLPLLFLMNSKIYFCLFYIFASRHNHGYC